MPLEAEKGKSGPLSKFHINEQSCTLVTVVGETKPCVHHWMIGSPNGDTSVGICDSCGETKVFCNTFDYAERLTGIFPELNDSEEDPFVHIRRHRRENPWP